MKTITKLVLINVVLITTLISCNKSKCEDSNAWNFDSESSCQYTKAIFYAGSDKVGGYAFKITKIEVFRRVLNENDLVGTITNLQEVNEAPVGCSVPEKGVEYIFTSATQEAIFVTRYYYENGVEENGETHTISTSNTQECIVKNLTL